MKRWIVALGALGFVAAAQAQTAAPATTPAAAATTSTSTAAAPAAAPSAPAPTVAPTQPDNARYLANPALLAECQARLDAFASNPCDIIFIGDSLTANWSTTGKAVWNQLYAPRKALDFGVDGDTTQNVIWRLNNMDLQNIHPRVAVVLIGKNNVDNSVHEVADGIKAVLTNTQIAFPNVKIILVSILPNGDDHDKLMQVNSIIRSYDDNTTVYYLNLVPQMPATVATDGSYSTTYKGLSSDRVHLDATGYQIWADAMEPLLRKLLGGG
jgi:lysophospholipase L1-like esterase